MLSLSRGNRPKNTEACSESNGNFPFSKYFYLFGHAHANIISDFPDS